MPAVLSRALASPRRGLVLAAALLLALPLTEASVSAQVCTGDCNDNGNVSSPELEQAIRIALDEVALSECEAADANDDGAVEIDDLTVAVNQRLSACAFVSPTPTETQPPTPTAPPGPLPDLVRSGVSFVGPRHMPCVQTPPSAFVEVCIQNVGPGDASSVDVLIRQNGGPGQTLSLFAFTPGSFDCGEVPSDFTFGSISVQVEIDPDGLVAEGNEANNVTTDEVQSNLPPVTCSPAGTPTATPLESATPTQTGSQTATRSPAGPTATPTFTPTASGTPTATRTPGLPDLVPNRVIVFAPTPVLGCVDSFNEIVVGLEVCVLNDGTGDAGPFQAVIQVAAEVTIPFENGVPADSEICLAAPYVDGQFIFEVDSDEQVTEAVESNNAEVFSLPRLTPPPLCPTRTATPG